MVDIIWRLSTIQTIIIRLYLPIGYQPSFEFYQPYGSYQYFQMMVDNLPYSANTFPCCLGLACRSSSSVLLKSYLSVDMCWWSIGALLALLVVRLFWVKRITGINIPIPNTTDFCNVSKRQLSKINTYRLVFPQPAPWIPSRLRAPLSSSLPSMRLGWEFLMTQRSGSYLLYEYEKTKWEISMNKWRTMEHLWTSGKKLKRTHTHTHFYGACSCLEYGKAQGLLTSISIRTTCGCSLGFTSSSDMAKKKEHTWDKLMVRKDPSNKQTRSNGFLPDCPPAICTATFFHGKSIMMRSGRIFSSLARNLGSIS